jgi:hypothetical protein
VVREVSNDPALESSANLVLRCSPRWSVAWHEFRALTRGSDLIGVVGPIGHEVQHAARSQHANKLVDHRQPDEPAMGLCRLRPRVGAEHVDAFERTRRDRGEHVEDVIANDSRVLDSLHGKCVKKLHDAGFVNFHTDDAPLGSLLCQMQHRRAISEAHIEGVWGPGTELVGSEPKPRPKFGPLQLPTSCHSTPSAERTGRRIRMHRPTIERATHLWPLHGIFTTEARLLHAVVPTV